MTLLWSYTFREQQRTTHNNTCKGVAQYLVLQMEFNQIAVQWCVANNELESPKLSNSYSSTSTANQIFYFDRQDINTEQDGILFSIEINNRQQYLVLCCQDNQIFQKCSHFVREVVTSTKYLCCQLQHQIFISLVRCSFSLGIDNIYRTY